MNGNTFKPRAGWIAAIVLAGLALRLAMALDARHFCPLVDDSFYAFSIARNIAAGEGVTYGGHPTNGFQPLFVFLIAPLFRLFGEHDALAIRASLVLLALVNAGTGLLLYGFLRRLKAPAGALLALVLWSFSPYVMANGVNGLETALTAAFLFASGWLYAARIRGRDRIRFRDSVWLGVLFGLGILSRIDMGFWAAAVAIDAVLFDRRAAAASRIACMAGAAIVAAAVCAPWFVYNLAVFGELLPTSGSGVRFISLAFGYNYWGGRYAYFPLDAIPLRYYALSLKTSLSDILTAFVEPLTLFTMRGFCVLALVALWLARRALPRLLRAHTALLWLPLFHVAAYSFWVFGQWFYPRYYFAVVAVLIAWAGLLFQALADRLPDLRRGAAHVAAVAAATLALLAWNSLPQQWLRGELEGGAEHRIGVNMLDGVVPPGATVGGFQSGALGYYASDWRIVNLDGVVNPAALDAMREKRMAEYVADENIDWLLDLDWIIDALYVRRSARANPLDDWELVATSGDMRLYRRRGGDDAMTGKGED